MKTLQGLFVIITAIALPHSALAADSWTLSGGSVSCGRIANVCVKLNSIVVNTTPNDPGSYEEWKMSINNYSQSRRFELSVKDSLNNRNIEYPVNKTVCEPYSRVRSENGIFNLNITGYESDWFFKEPVPKIQALVRDGNCNSYGGATSDKTGMNINWCKTSSDRKRIACYKLNAYYNMMPVSEPTGTSCTSTYNACNKQCEQAGGIVSICKKQCTTDYQRCRSSEEPAQ
jgi:hypothetical protein